MVKIGKDATRYFEKNTFLLPYSDMVCPLINGVITMCTMCGMGGCRGREARTAECRRPVERWRPGKGWRIPSNCRRPYPAWRSGQPWDRL